MHVAISAQSAFVYCAGFCDAKKKILNPIRKMIAKIAVIVLRIMGFIVNLLSFCL